MPLEIYVFFLSFTVVYSGFLDHVTKHPSYLPCNKPETSSQLLTPIAQKNQAMDNIMHKMIDSFTFCRHVYGPIIAANEIQQLLLGFLSLIEYYKLTTQCNSIILQPHLLILHTIFNVVWLIQA